MNNAGIILLILIGVNVIVSYQGFQNLSFFEKYKFQIDRILVDKDYKRLITSGFLHGGWTHLVLNMLALYMFGDNVEYARGSTDFLVIYFTSLIGGGLLSLYLHRNHGDYAAVGASGAVSGVVFAAIALFPGMKMGLLFIPIHLPAWLFGLLFVIVSIYGIKSNKGNIGHDAHLGGGIIGMIVAILMEPQSLMKNTLPIALILIPSVIFIYLIIKKPEALIINKSFFSGSQGMLNKDQKWNTAKREKEKNIDKILDKINEKGIDSLNEFEKKQLDDYSSKK